MSLLSRPHNLYVVKKKNKYCELSKINTITLYFMLNHEHNKIKGEKLKHFTDTVNITTTEFVRKDVAIKMKFLF